MERPLCFVLMPFGKKNDAKGDIFDFDAVYEHSSVSSLADESEASLDREGGSFPMGAFRSRETPDCRIGPCSTCGLQDRYPPLPGRVPEADRARLAHNLPVLARKRVQELGIKTILVACTFLDNRRGEGAREASPSPQGLPPYQGSPGQRKATIWVRS